MPCRHNVEPGRPSEDSELVGLEKNLDGASAGWDVQTVGLADLSDVLSKYCAKMCQAAQYEIRLKASRHILLQLKAA
jgi:hypothetical protein